ncbi:MAG TPA: hypothetical protein VF297_28595 [Pyrinomonadaceae bacterium]
MGTDKIDIGDIEIIGFNSVPTGACGQARPFARLIQTGRERADDEERVYFKFVTRKIGEAADKYEVVPEAPLSRREMDHLAEEGKVTWLPKELKAEPHYIIFYVASSLLADADVESPEGLALDFNWHKLWDAKVKEDTWAVYDSEARIGGLRSRSVERLEKKITRLLKLHVTFLDHNLHAEAEENRAEAERIAGVAYYTNINPGLYPRILLPYGLAVKLSGDPQSLIALYEWTVRRKIPGLSFNDFLDGINRLEATIRNLQPTTARAAVAAASAHHGNHNGKQDEINEIREKFKHIRAIKDDAKRLELSREATDGYRGCCLPDEENVEELLSEQRGDWLTLDDVTAYYIAACEIPSFYDPEVILLDGMEKDRLNLTRLHRVYDELKRSGNGIKAGPLGRKEMVAEA